MEMRGTPITPPRLFRSTSLRFLVPPALEISARQVAHLPMKQLLYRHAAPLPPSPLALQSRFPVGTKPT